MAKLCRATVAAGRRGALDLEVLDFQDVACVENEGVEGLFFSGWSNLSFEGEVLEIGADRRWTKLFRCVVETTHAEANEAPAPGDVGLFGRDSELGEADGSAEGIGGFLEDFLFAGSGCAVVVGARFVRKLVLPVGRV